MHKKNFSTHGKGRRTDRERGVVTAEFALLLPVFLMIIVGIVEFGHLWHLQHTITNASREGARAAIILRKVYDQAAIKQTATDTINTYLGQFLPPGVWQVEFPNANEPPAVYNSGANFRVRVTTTEGLMLLDKLIPSLQGLIVVEAETTMKLE